MKIKTFNILILLIFIAAGCVKQPVTPPGNLGQIELKLNFHGEAITQPEFSKRTAAAGAYFSKMLIDIYETGTQTECLNEVMPFLTTELEIDMATGTFAGEFEVPAGNDRLLRLRLYETALTGDSTQTLTYAGRRAGVEIAVDQINEIEMDLYPVPIKNKRIVLWVDPLQEIPDQSLLSVPVAVATADSLLGFQFDVEFIPADMEIEELQKTALSENFSDIHFNPVSEQSTRVVIFDRTDRRNALQPTCDVTAVPEPFVYLKTRSLDESVVGSTNYSISLQNGVVNTIDFLPLEVWAVGNPEAAMY